MSEKRVTKRWQKALEKIFEAEIYDRLPLQSKAKVFDELASEGMVKEYTRNFGRIEVRGWALTQYGRFTYCVCCDEPEAA